MHRGCFVWTATCRLSGRRTPRPAPRVSVFVFLVCVRGCTRPSGRSPGRVWRAGLPCVFQRTHPSGWLPGHSPIRVASWPGWAGRPLGRVLVRLTVPVSVLPPPRRLLLVVRGVPRPVVCCRGLVWAVLCGLRWCAGVRVPCCLVCCSVVLLASSLAVSRWRRLRRFCWCCAVPCCTAQFCAVSRRVSCCRASLYAVVFSLVLCSVVVAALLSLCLLSSAHLQVCLAWCRPPARPLCVCGALCRLVLPRCAGLLCALRCCVAACCVVLFGVRRAVLCCVVPCCAPRVVWCCVVFPRVAGPCRVLCRFWWRCVVLLCAALFAGVLRFGALCCAVPLCAVVACCVPSGVWWRGAVDCVLCCAVLVFAAVCCAAPLGGVSGCAVLCCPRCGLLCLLSRVAGCCVVPPGAVLGRIASCCAVCCSAVMHCAAWVVLCCVVSWCVVSLRAVACPRVLCGADAEPGTPWPPNHVFCTDSQRQLIDALIANRPALAAILFYHFITGARGK